MINEDWFVASPGISAQLIWTGIWGIWGGSVVSQFNTAVMFVLNLIISSTLSFKLPFSRLSRMRLIIKTFSCKTALTWVSCSGSTTFGFDSPPATRPHSTSYIQSIVNDVVPFAFEDNCWEAMKRDCRNFRLVSIFFPSFIPFFRSNDGSGGLGMFSTTWPQRLGAQKKPRVIYGEQFN